MAIGGRGIEVKLDQVEIDRLLESEDGPVGRMLQRQAETVAQGAKRRAPVSADGSNGRRSGYLRSQIGWEIGRDSDGLYADIATPATTPSGEPYGMFQEVGTSRMSAQPHLRPALDDLR